MKLTIFLITFILLFFLGRFAHSVDGYELGTIVLNIIGFFLGLASFTVLPFLPIAALLFWLIDRSSRKGLRSHKNIIDSAFFLLCGGLVSLHIVVAHFVTIDFNTRWFEPAVEALSSPRTLPYIYLGPFLFGWLGVRLSKEWRTMRSQEASLPAAKLHWGFKGIFQGAVLLLLVSTLLLNGAIGDGIIGQARGLVLRDEPENVHGSSRLAFSPDGDKALVAAKDRSLVLWDLKSRKQIKTFNIYPLQAATSMAFLPDGKTALVGFIAPYKKDRAQQTPLALIDLETGQLIREFFGHQAVIERIEITPDGQRAVTTSEDTTVKLWDIQFGKLLASYGTCFQYASRYQTCDPDEQMPLPEEILWPGGYMRYPRNPKEVASIALSPDGKSVLIATAQGRFIHWRFKEQTQEVFEDTSTYPISRNSYSPSFRHLVFSPDGKTFAVNYQERIDLWDIEAKKRIAESEPYSFTLVQVAFTPDGKHLLSSSRDGIIRLDSINSETVIEFPIRGPHNLSRLKFSPKGDKALAYVHEGELILLFIE